jgi:inner membrane protein
VRSSLASKGEIVSIVLMDPISHAVFGASISQAIWWKKYWNKVTILGWLIAMLPDIDIVLQYIPAINPLQASFFHRTMTHSLLFALCVAPLLGFLIKKLFPKKWITWRTWTVVFLVALLSHIFLDLCTTYGIRLFWPFVDYGYEWNIITVIDVFFTIPLWCLVLITRLLERQKRYRKKWGRVRYCWVVFVAIYLAFLWYLQHSLKASMRDDMQKAGMQYERLFASPQFLQPFLRYGVIALPDGSYKVLHTSIFDTKPRLYQNVYWYHAENEHISRQNAWVGEMIARSHGWYLFEKVWNELYFIDIRFPRFLWWDASKAQLYPFKYRVAGENTPEQVAQWLTIPVQEAWDEYRSKVRGRE